jgi:peptidoglycan-associated lipoprotein
MQKILGVAAISNILAACSSTPETQNPAPVAVRGALSGGVPGGPGSATSPAGSGSLSGSAIPPGGSAAAGAAAGANRLTPLSTDPRNPLSKRSVYYDFDSFVIKDEFRPLIEAHGKYLRDNRAAQIVVQGNTDERGGREYNLALGHKRAESVKRALAIMGVQEQQVETVSFGKEKPKAQGSDEAAWAENRRSDIVYRGE